MSESTCRITSASASGKKQSAKGKNLVGGNPYHPRKTPQWQKPITTFFKHPVPETDSPTLSVECTADKDEIMTQDEAVAVSNVITADSPTLSIECTADSPTLSIECTADEEEIMHTQDEAVAASNFITATADISDQSMSTSTADTCDQSMSTSTADTSDQCMSNILICDVFSLPADCYDALMYVNVLEELPENN